MRIEAVYVDECSGMDYRSDPGESGRSRRRAYRAWRAGRPTMAMITDATLALETEVEGLAFAREVLRVEAEALERVRQHLPVSIARAADLIHRCSGSVIVTGMGKAG